MLDTKHKFSNITEEKFEQIMDSLIKDKMSVGLHGVLYNNPSITAERIIATGLNMSTQHSGLTGTIKFYETSSPTCYHDMMKYAYGNQDEKGNIYTIIVTIPETILASDGKEYFLGHYYYYSGLGKDDDRAHSLPTHDCEKLPKELVVGCSEYNCKSHEYNLYVNPSYIEFMDIDKKLEFYDNYLNNLKQKPFSFDEESYNKVRRIADILLPLHNSSITDDKNTYYRQFIEEYEERQKHKQR